MSDQELFSQKGGGLAFGDEIAHAVTCHQAKGGDPTTDNYVAHSLRADGFDASEDGTGRGTPIVSVFDPRQITNKDHRGGGRSDRCHSLHEHAPAIAFTSKDHGADAGEVAPTLRSMGHDKSHANGGGQIAVAFKTDQDPEAHGDICPTLQQPSPSGGGQQHAVLTGMAVRRLTPRECERLQGFPDDYTLVAHRKKPAADGPRYKALGNSMAVNVMRWIGYRIAAVERITAELDVRGAA